MTLRSRGTHLEEVLEADTVVVVSYHEPNSGLADHLHSFMADAPWTVHLTGDVNGTNSIQAAIHESAAIARGDLTSMTETTTGTDRSAGVAYSRLLDADTHPVRGVFRRESPMTPGNLRVPASVYHSRAFHDLEVERLWSRVWQLACLEDDIPHVGDHHVYDIASLSFLVVRTGPEEFKAFRNACLHRGRLLRPNHGKGLHDLRCAFHGWCWNLDGSLKEIPCQWDFPDVDPADCSLPEALVDTWHGFVFINPDRGAKPLAEFLRGLDEHFAPLPFERRQKTAHVRKVMPVNWKVCQEAFMESYHVVATHPTLLSQLGDANSRYDVYENFSRAVSPQGIPSPHLADRPEWGPLPEPLEFARYRHPMSGHVYERHVDGTVRIVDHRGTASVFDEDANWISGPLTNADPHLCKWIGGPILPGMETVPHRKATPPEGVEGRPWLAEQARSAIRQEWGSLIDVDGISDAEMIDSIFYSVFPNWSPWGIFSPLFYRFRPDGDDPESCIFEVMLFTPAPDPERRPPPAPVTDLGPDDDWSLAPELGSTCKIFQQDSLNLPLVQRGLHAQERQQVVFSSYQESKIRHFYSRLFEWLDIGTDVEIRGRVAAGLHSADGRHSRRRFDRSRRSAAPTHGPAPEDRRTRHPDRRAVAGRGHRRVHRTRLRGHHPLRHRAPSGCLDPCGVQPLPRQAEPAGRGEPP